VVRFLLDGVECGGTNFVSEDGWIEYTQNMQLPNASSTFFITSQIIRPERPETRNRTTREAQSTYSERFSIQVCFLMSWWYIKLTGEVTNLSSFGTQSNN
jgi:hypothetical protein